MSPLQKDAKPKDSKKKKRGKVIIKMDVEGAEYGVLKEVSKSGVLCDYVAKGNRAILLVEFHGRKVIEEEKLKKTKAGIKLAQATLQECGVQFIDLKPGWS
jgi:hypothetical protein